MSLPRSDSRLLVWSAAFLVSLAACGSSTGDGGGEGGSPGTGGNATGGTTGTGGAGPSTGGNTGTGGNGTGGSGPATGGSVGTGGHATGGAPAGTGGSAPGTGGSASGGTGPGTGGAGGKGTGGMAPGGHAGTGAGGSATGGAGGSGPGTGGSGSMSSGCGKAPTIASSNYNNGHHIAITVGSMAREYILNVPTNYDNTKPYKFVIAYHELNGNDDEMYKNQYYHLLSLSNNTTIFVAPNGQQNNANCTQASGCGWPNPSDTDMKFADAVVAQVEQNFCVDTGRIFATGWSYGASMSEQTACERPLTGVSATNTWGVRAIAVYSVAYLSNTTNCKATSSKPVAYYASHGTTDSVLPYSGGVTMAQTWAAADGCTAATPTQATGSHVCTNYAGCATGYPVEFCSFVGDHTPDPKDSGGGTSWEYQNVWTFLSQF
jgi:poly(3-hydroxybutyrate) depolymerase